jgi:signal transduction histidine kinase
MRESQRGAFAAAPTGNMGNQLWQRRLLIAVFGLLAAALVFSTLVSSVSWINRPFPGFFVHENLTVGPYFLPGWSGGAAGIRSLDRILSINSRELKSRHELYELVKGRPAGDLFHYRVERQGQVVALTVASMKLAFHDWFLSFGVYIVIGLAFLVIGVAPYYFRAPSPAALPLCFMVVAVFLWFLSTFDFMTAGTLPREVRIFGLTFTPGAAIHLALLLRGGQPLWRTRPLLLIANYGWALLLGGLISATFFGPLDIWMMVFRLGYAYTLAGAFTFLAITGWASRVTASDLERSRLRVMFVGAFIGFVIPTFSTVLTSSFNVPIPYNLALVPTVFFPISVAYALLKYSLFDLGNVLRVGLSRAALAAFLLAIYALLALFAGPWAGIYGSDPLVPIFFSILVVLLFNPLLRWLEGAVDRYVYRQDYDPAVVQQEISLFLRSLAEPQALASGFLQRVSARIGISCTALAYRPKNANHYFTAFNESALGKDRAAADDVSVAASLWEENSYRGIFRDEVADHPRYHARRERVLQLFDDWGAELILPLVFERQVRGLVSCGAKRSAKEYSAEDLRLLGTLTDQLALSLENGKLYEETVKAYDEAAALNRRLIEMDRVKKQFVANICHELRTPVSTIIGYGEILRDENFKGDARSILDRLVNNGQELSQLMDNLMNFARMEADADATRFETIRLREILAGLEIMTRRLIRRRPIEFNQHLETSIDAIESDAQKLQQILVQLLTNALKFTEKGNIDLTLRALEENGGKFLEIAVADTGIGIKNEDQEVIFDDFRQLDGSSSRTYGGTGLGLGLCRRLAAALGGTIRVSSKLGVGSVFSLILPVNGAYIPTGHALSSPSSTVFH